MSFTSISGLEYIDNFLTTEQQELFLDKIDSLPWQADLKRRVQHYGYRYSYKSKQVAGDPIAPLPDWAVELSELIREREILQHIADQVIINEYLPGQGIAPHIDSVTDFAETIVSISLGSQCVMSFDRDSQAREEILLNPGSLLKLAGEARYNWKHSIACRKNDNYNGNKLARSRRVSITLRKVIFRAS